VAGQPTATHTTYCYRTTSRRYRLATAYLRCNICILQTPFPPPPGALTPSTAGRMATSGARRAGTLPASPTAANCAARVLANGAGNYLAQARTHAGADSVTWTSPPRRRHLRTALPGRKRREQLFSLPPLLSPARRLLQARVRRQTTTSPHGGGRDANIRALRLLPAPLTYAAPALPTLSSY